MLLKSLDKNLLITDGNLFMKIDNSAVEFSKSDISKKIKLPKILTPELAEIIGIILGDGHLIHNKKYALTTMYLLVIAGSLSEDLDYYTNKINPMFSDLFNSKFKIASRRDDELIVRLNSKAITTFFKNLGIKSGNKTDDNFIPKIVLNSNNDIKKGLIRGVFDTEGTITFKKDYFGKHSKPIVSVKMKSEKFILQLKKLLEELGFNPKLYREDYFDRRFDKLSIRHRIDLAGKKKLQRYLKVIGFRNPRHFTKIAIWRKFGFYPPRLVYQQRTGILDGKLNIENIYKF